MNFPVHAYAHTPTRHYPPTEPQVDPNNPASVAADILARISAYDSTAPIADDNVVRRWAEVIRAANIDYDWLREGVIRVYASGGEPPKMKLSAVIDAAKDARRDARKGQAIRELGPAPSFADEAVHQGETGYAIPQAYNTNRAVDLPCESCGAPAGEWCEQGEQGHREIKKIPCTTRLALAYRTNNPEGRRRHQEKQAHLAKHRRTFEPNWTN